MINLSVLKIFKPDKVINPFQEPVEHHITFVYPQGKIDKSDDTHQKTKKH